MPKVPTYDNFQASPNVMPVVPVRAPEIPDIGGQQAQQIGAALTNASRGVAAIEDKINNSRVDDVHTQLLKVRTDLQVEASNLKGKNALERPDKKSLADEYTEKLKKAEDDLAKSLGNESQRKLFSQRAGAMRSQFYGALSSHMLAQQNEYQKETWNAKIETAQNQAALLWGDANLRKQSVDEITSTVDAMASAQGWDKTTREAELSKAMSPMHAGVINGLIKAGRANEAKSYYDENSAGMTLQTRARLQDAVNEAARGMEADTTAEQVWSKFGPRTTNDAVNIFDMEAEARKVLRDKPDVLRTTIAGIRERAQAFNAQQSERNAQAVNSVFALVDSGTPMSAVRRSDAWLALPEVKRHEITKAMEAEAYTREQRALAAEQRGLVNAQRADRALLLQNADSYLADSDPNVLMRASRDQVASLRTKYGMEATQHLLDRYDALKKNPADLTDARMDSDAFKRIGKDFGYNTYDPKGQSDKEKLGTLQYRVEKAIAAEQARAGRKLSQDEKERVMRREFSDEAKVTVKGRAFGSEQVPVIQLDAGQAKRVAVPQADRQRIAQKMAQRYQMTQDPRFAPTEENLRYWYLQGKSSTASTIPSE